MQRMSPMLQGVARLESRLDMIEAMQHTFATKADVQELKAMIAESKYDLLKALVPIMVALFSVGVAIILFAMNRLLPPLAIPQSPIVIQLPSSTSPAVTPPK